MTHDVRPVPDTSSALRCEVAMPCSTDGVGEALRVTYRIVDEAEIPVEWTALIARLNLNPCD